MSVYIERQKNVVFFFLSSPDGDEMYGEKKIKNYVLILCERIPRALWE